MTTFQQENSAPLSNDDVTDVTDVQPMQDAGSDVTAEEMPDVTAVTDASKISDFLNKATEPGKSEDDCDLKEVPSPSEQERPCYRAYDEWTKIPEGKKRKPGVYYHIMSKGTQYEPPQPVDIWICGPLHIEAQTFDNHGSSFGRMLRFKNSAGKWITWAMPMELLRGSGEEMRGELLAMGLEINPNSHKMLGNFLQHRVPLKEMRCVLQTGWCDNSFVLPDAVIGPDAKEVIFQSGERTHEEYSQSGSLDCWIREISARAIGNPMLILGLSASFAGPLLKNCNAEGGGIHLLGDSSSGKTTIIEAACSVWGGKSYMRTWRATANGMEGAAALFNDGLLALDEISQCEPREVGEIVYALGNGHGKQRARRSGAARSVTRWLCFVLSSGERTIATTMSEGGLRTKAGQSVRLLDIPTQRKIGCWDEIHELPNGAAFSDAIKRGAAKHYGRAGRAFLERLTNDKRDFAAELERIKTLPQFVCNGAEGQEKRVAARFALLALAGELAMEYGITGWPEGAATKAAEIGFQAWKSLRGRGNDERRKILEQLSGFIERHGDSRFSSCEDGGVSIRDRAGWWRKDGDTLVYLFNAEGLREALKGFDFNRALDLLEECGVIPKAGASGERAKPERIAGRVTKLYEVKVDALGGSTIVTPVTPCAKADVSPKPLETLIVTPVTSVTPENSGFSNTNDATQRLAEMPDISCLGE